MDIQHTLDAITGHGQTARPIGDAERHKLIVGWNQTAEEYPRSLCFHQLFEAQVDRSPSSAAVEFEGQQLTYEELNNRANHVANHLRLLGVGPEVLVGICVEPSFEMLVGLLGILKAGGAYVPMDPGYPMERLAFMLEDTAMPVLLTMEKLRNELPKKNIHLVDVDVILRGWQNEPSPNPASGVAAENLAYVIYTSGSTGQPKGVMIPHRGLVNYLTWAVKAYRVADGAGAPVHSSISFDLTITGLFSPLLTGRCVHVVPGNQGPAGLSSALARKEPFSLVKITPAHLEVLRHQLSQTATSSRSGAFVIGGEALYGEDLVFWQKHMPQTVLVNEYGPTETVVGCCVYVVSKGEHLKGRVPIGRPIANTQLYVLDAEMRPVPLGVTGELYIGGDCLARGYLNRPELTGVTFLSNPFVAMDPKASTVIYKTGDLVRYRSDGNLEFLGRIDDQVKVRGYRVEPGEIEEVLSTHPGVLCAKVFAHSDSPGEQSLVAYLVAKSPPGPTVTELRQFLRNKLPSYMVPATYVKLARFPLTPNGKVDRQAFPAPHSQWSASGTFVAPRTEIEHVVTDIWQTVFQREEIGVRDDFFDLGGHSLMGTRLIAEINRTLHANLEVTDLLESPTIEGLARSLLKNDRHSNSSRLVRLRRGSSGRSIIFLNAPMGVLRLSRLMETQHSIYTNRVPFSANVVQAAIDLNWKDIPNIADLAAEHTKLIKEAGLAQHCILAGYSSGGPLAVEVANQMESEGIFVDAVLLFDADIHSAGWNLLKRWCRKLVSQGVRHGWNHASTAAGERLQYEWRELTASLRKDKGASVLPSGLSKTVSGEMPWEIEARIWLKALDGYHPRKLSSRGILFRAQESIFTERLDFNERLAWTDLFANGLDVFKVPGDHRSMWKEPNLPGLAKTCSTSLGLQGRAATAS